uniref:Uncharacterized protein n=1 Tax=Timema tahoe TaxID=61484 RepID=A0A7R9IEE5_9NEOP|nr:unnamed protein product [Timema tahoe]
MKGGGNLITSRHPTTSARQWLLRTPLRKPVLFALRLAQVLDYCVLVFKAELPRSLGHFHEDWASPACDVAVYTASMGEPPKGTYYPASTPQGSANQQPIRPYQFNATNPWEREEREKV